MCIYRFNNIVISLFASCTPLIFYLYALFKLYYQFIYYSINFKMLCNEAMYAR